MKKNHFKVFFAAFIAINTLIESAIAKTTSYPFEPYTILLTNSGNFGEKGHTSTLSIEYQGQPIFLRETKSQLKEFELYPPLTKYENQVLQVVYRELQDGLDPKKIHMLKIVNGHNEEAIITFDPMNPNDTLQIIKTSPAWTPSEIQEIAAKVLKIPNKSPQPKTDSAPIRGNPNTPNPQNSENSTPLAPRPRSIEW